MSKYFFNRIKIFTFTENEQIMSKTLTAEEFLTDWINDVSNEYDANERLEYSEREVEDMLRKYKEHVLSTQTKEEPLETPHVGKIIIVNDCMECPKAGKCVAWKKLTPKQKFTLKTGVGIGKFILKDCPLDDFTKSTKQ